MLIMFFFYYNKKKKKKNFYKNRTRRQQRWEKGIEKKFDPVIRVTEGYERSANKKYRYLITSYEEINPKDPRFLLTFRDIKYLKKKYPALSNDFFEVPPLILYTIKSPEPRLSKNPFFLKKIKESNMFNLQKRLKIKIDYFSTLFA